MLSSMSQSNVREALSQFEREARRSVETHLANVETSFDLGYLQTEDGWSQLCYLLSVYSAMLFTVYTICDFFFTT